MQQDLLNKMVTKTAKPATGQLFSEEDKANLKGFFLFFVFCFLFFVFCFLFFVLLLIYFSYSPQLQTHKTFEIFWFVLLLL